MTAHPFEPVFSASSKILILGSFPSVRSREEGFYYGHPQNRFWKLLALIYAEEVPRDIPSKRAMLLAHNLALWDAVKACDITASSDSSIRHAEPNDIRGLISKTRVTAVLANGRTAYTLYQRHCARECGINAVLLPSTSPANAGWTLEKLAAAWSYYIIN